MNRITILTAILIALSSCTQTYDVVVVGAGASGVAAGLQAARMGAKTLIIEETPWLGGMLTSAGVSAIDGNYNLPSGFWGEFKDALAEHYGGPDKIDTGWVSNVLFEPSVGNEIFHRFVAAEPNLTLLKETKVAKLSKCDNGWALELSSKEGLKAELTLGSSKPKLSVTSSRIVARRLVDATELGDIAKACGVKYDIGMESRAQTGEDIGPDVSNDIIQDLTFVAILKDYGRDMSIAEPEAYDKWEFAGSCANPLCINPKEPDRIWPKEQMITYGKLPNDKYMINWPVEGNDFYINLIEMTEEERAEALKEAKLHTMRFVYFIQHELGYTNLGLADDEYPTEDKLPFIPYHRESRRIHGKVRFTVNSIIRPFENNLYRTGIAVGDYPVDQHHMRYNGEEQLPNLYYRPVPSYSLPMGTLIPQDVEDLIVAEKSISVSNIVNGSSRLQPVVLQIGQAAGAIAAISASSDRPVSKVSVREVQDVLLKAGTYLMPYLDVPKSNPRFKAYQRIGACGALRGEGKRVGWSNQTLLRAADPMMLSELDGLFELYPEAKELRSGCSGCSRASSCSDTDDCDSAPLDSNAADYQLTALELLTRLNNVKRLDMNTITKTLMRYSYELDNPNQLLTRGDAAIIIDAALDPFHSLDIDIEGNII